MLIIWIFKLGTTRTYLYVVFILFIIKYCLHGLAAI